MNILVNYHQKTNLGINASFRVSRLSNFTKGLFTIGWQTGCSFVAANWDSVGPYTLKLENDGLNSSAVDSVGFDTAPSASGGDRSCG